MALTYRKTSWNGIEVHARLSDGFVNASELCKIGNKKFPDWYRTAEAKRVVQELKEQLKKELQDKLRVTPNSTSHISRVELDGNVVVVEINEGNCKRGSIRGSWVHPDLALCVAQWACPKFFVQVSRWIRELLITGSVQVTSQKSNEELNEMLRKQVEEEAAKAKKYQEELDATRKQLATINQEKLRLQNLYLSSFKWNKYANKGETIYILSTRNYASQGLFKIGRTRNLMKSRLIGHNVSRVAGDKMVVLAEFKVHNSVAVEAYIHKSLAPLRRDSDHEFYMAPFHLLKRVVELIIDNDSDVCDEINKIIDFMESLRAEQTAAGADVWMNGIEEKVFDIEEEKKSELPFKPTKELSVHANWTAEQRKEYTAYSLCRYLADVTMNAAGQYVVVWREFQEYLLKQLVLDYGLPKCHFQPKDWRDALRAHGDRSIAIQWRSGDARQ